MHIVGWLGYRKKMIEPFIGNNGFQDGQNDEQCVWPLKQCVIIALTPPPVSLNWCKIVHFEKHRSTIKPWGVHYYIIILHEMQRLVAQQKCIEWRRNSHSVVVFGMCSEPRTIPSLNAKYYDLRFRYERLKELHV